MSVTHANIPLDSYLIFDLTFSFHLRLLELAENPLLAHAVHSVHLMIFAYQLGLTRSPAETIEEHWAILAALRRQDPEASETAMRLHMRRSRERYDREADAEEARGAGEHQASLRLTGKKGRRGPARGQGRQ